MSALACRQFRSEEHTSELQSHSEISYAVFCLKKKKNQRETEGTLDAGVGQRLEAGGLWLHRSGGRIGRLRCSLFFFFNDTATTEIYTNLNTLSLHDALPI